MNYALTFSRITCGYAVHAVNCCKALNVVGTFATVAEATAEAHADESEKAGKPTKAKVHTCRCAKM